MDTATAEENPADLARHIIRHSLTTVLSTVDRSGAPFGSLVSSACDYDAGPLFLMSTLASHTRNIEKDPRVSLLFDGTRALDVPLTGPRVTVSGVLERTEVPRHRQRFLRRHEDAALYADFADFSFFRLNITRAWLVAGFGRVNKISATELLAPCAIAGDLEAREDDIVSHMNNDHGDALDDIARYYCAADNNQVASRAQAWRMTGLDAQGLDLRHGGLAGRIEFPEILADIDQVRNFLVNLAKNSKKGD